MVESLESVGTRSCEVLAYIDDDDASVYPILSATSEISLMRKRGPSNGVGAAWNDLAKYATGSFLMLANDDLVFCTEGWDGKIRAAITKAGFDDYMFVAWCDDGAPHPERRCTFPIVPREWVDAVGVLVPPIFNFLYHDTWIHEVGKKVGNLLPIMDVLIEHRHFSFGKGDYDDTYRRHRTGVENVRRRREDRMMFAKTDDLREQWAARLREYEELS
jgi:hypothetical protein